MTQEPTFLLLKAQRLIDGGGGPPLENAALLVQSGRIALIGPQAAVRVPEGASARAIDYQDATILPGLVDAHTHLVMPGDGTPADDVAKEEDEILLLQAARNARTILESGVTTIRENGAKGRTAFSLREGVRRGLAVGPRMVICGRPITITGGHMWYFGAQADGARIVLSRVDDPVHLRHLGVARIDGERVVEIIEKPDEPPSDLVVTGVYFYDASVFDVVRTLVPSGRGELEITDVNNYYVALGRMEHDVIDGFWGDAGESIDAYHAVNDFVRTWEAS